MDILRTLGPPLLAVATALWVDATAARRGLQPPAFAGPTSSERSRGGLVRRNLASAALAFVLWIGVFLPLGALGSGIEPDLSAVGTADLFLLHGLLVATLAVWWGLGYGTVARRPGAGWRAQFGFEAPDLKRELAIGLVAGLASWFVVIAVMLGVGALALELGGEGALPAEPPAMIVWIAALPLGVRLAVAVSAGVVEEAFFRGFLQPRVGVAASSGLFILAHLSYDQPFMLLGVGLLSLFYAALVVWRQSVWAAVAAHFVFDAIQLLVVVPAALEMMPGDAAEAGGGAGLTWLSRLVSAAVT